MEADLAKIISPEQKQAVKVGTTTVPAATVQSIPSIPSIAAPANQVVVKAPTPAPAAQVPISSTKEIVTHRAVVPKNTTPEQ